MKASLFIGLLIWLAGTIAIRFTGRAILAPGRPAHTLVLYAVSFLVMAVVIPGICQLLRLERTRWFEAVALLILPTLLFDSLSCAFFSRIFPNIAPDAAGVFGGWMLVCCAGAVAGVWIRV
jgi:hypothetical protein